MLRLIGKFFQAGASIGFAVPRLQNDTRMSHSNSLPLGRVAAHTQLMLFRRASTRDVDHESLMTWGLVGWCFSRRTHRRGRMITCRARAARCTRKPSPRPLPG